MDGQRSADDMPVHYLIQVRGTLDPRWSAWFDQLAISHDAEGNTLLVGPIIDQAALYGVLRKIRDGGMLLLSVNRVEPGQARRECRRVHGHASRSAVEMLEQHMA